MLIRRARSFLAWAFKGTPIGNAMVRIHNAAYGLAPLRAGADYARVKARVKWTQVRSMLRAKWAQVSYISRVKWTQVRYIYRYYAWRVRPAGRWLFRSNETHNF